VTRPRIVVSRCLGFEHCRWDGRMMSSPLVERLRPHVEFLTVCPEMEMGMGVPRPPIRLVRQDGDIRLRQPGTGADLTEPMRAWCAGRLDDLADVDGFLLQSRSPSCGLRDVKLYPAMHAEAPVPQKASGFFAAAVLERCPGMPTESEGRLTNFRLREHFLASVFTLARFREARAVGDIQALTGFHARHKYAFMAANQRLLKEMGAVAANGEHLPMSEVFARYEALLRRLLATLPNRKRHVNVLLHLFGYFSDDLSTAEKGFFLAEVERFRVGELPLAAVTAVLRGWVVRYNNAYLQPQTYFSPYPPELADLGDSGGGRDL